MESGLGAAQRGVVTGIGFVGCIRRDSRLIQDDAGDGYIDPAKSFYRCAQRLHWSMSAAHCQDRYVRGRGQFQSLRATQQRG